MATDALKSTVTIEAVPRGRSFIRKLSAGDVDLYRAHLLRLDREDRHARFCGTVSDHFIRQYANAAISKADVILGLFVDGELRGAAELRRLQSQPDAEISFSVERPWQGRGVGSALLAQILLAARNRHICRLQMICLPGNGRMQQLARKFNAELSLQSGSVIGEIVAHDPVPANDDGRPEGGSAEVAGKAAA